jgi:hypothetical protein
LIEIGRAIEKVIKYLIGRVVRRVKEWFDEKGDRYKG